MTLYFVYSRRNNPDDSIAVLNAKNKNINGIMRESTPQPLNESQLEPVSKIQV